ncbi:MAG TPA: cation-translocating P-type ATPase [bacterium]|nr:cation-translocating P-type ATPase [bacterium]
MNQPHFHALSIEEVFQTLKTHLEKGLTSSEVRTRLEKYGFNELKEKPRPGWWQRLKLQFDSFLIRLLLAAALVSLFLGELLDAGAIIAILLLNAFIGVLQEMKADRALLALKKMASPTARVVRDGQEQIIPARELVVGDLVILEAGNYVPADVRLVESVNLKIDESVLTGEASPVSKEALTVLDREIPLGDRFNSAFMGTLVTYGRGRALVVATGSRTQVGLIAEMLQETEEEPTPLQRKLEELGRWLGKATLIICAVVFLLGLLRETSLTELWRQGLAFYLSSYRQEIILLFMTAVSLAIAAVPEGLPAVVTICLALGMQRLARKKALVRKLTAVETLGCTTVICSDKTGTLTQNQMTVTAGWVTSGRFEVTGQGYLPEGEFFSAGKRFDPLSRPAVKLLLTAATACNDARLEPSGEEDGRKTYRVIGDPTEAALVVCAAKAGLWPWQLHPSWPRVAEVPFDSERKLMSTIHRLSEKARGELLSAEKLAAEYVIFVKGAPEELLRVCRWIFSGETLEPMSPQWQEKILQVNREMASQALRVLAVGFRLLKGRLETVCASTVEQELVFVGLLGMMDPARPEVFQAIRQAETAGIRTVMVTGDYPDTAVAVAEQIGLKRPDGLVLDGTRLANFTAETLADLVEKVDIFARVCPRDKTVIVEALKKRGQVVAMTGDGINDAPALKKADIGVAMGITGTDVAKETADLILTDDNYATIVAAVEEGRIIYANIRKFVFYLISCNVGEILIIFSAMVAGWPLPLRPIHLLWLNLVTDGAPALALGLEKGEPGLMKQKPRSVTEPVINKSMLTGVVVQAVAMTVAMLAVFSWNWRNYGQLARAQTAVFACLVLSELWRAYTVRSEYGSVFSRAVSGNRWLHYSVGSSLILLLMVLEVPFLRAIFGTVFLSLKEWRVVLLFSLLPSLAAELTKFFSRQKKPAVRESS